MSQHEGVLKFEKELKMIPETEVNAFVHNAIVEGPESFWKDDELVSYTRKVVKVTNELLERDNVPSPIKDVILAGALLCDVAKNEVSKELTHMHPVLGKVYIQDSLNMINPQLSEAVCKIIQSHEGDETPIKELEPKQGGPEHLVALAHRIVQADFITISL